MKKACLILFIILLAGCGHTPELIHNQDQFAIVQYNGLGGNKIIIPNLDQIRYYYLYRFRRSDSAFAFVKKLKRPGLPKLGNLAPYAIEYVDYMVTDTVPYKIEGVRDSGKRWFDVEIRYMDLKK